MTRTTCVLGFSIVMTIPTPKRGGMWPNEKLPKQPPSGRCDKWLTRAPDFLSQAEGLEPVAPDSAEDSRVDSLESCLEAM